MCSLLRFAQINVLKRFKTDSPISTITQSVGKHRKRRRGVYLWGSNHSAALGQPNYLIPPPHKNKIYQKKIPAPLKHIFEKKLTPQHVALGYGFTLVIGSNGNNQSLIGFGSNSSSQVGPRTSQTDHDILIEPTEIDLPSASLTGVAAGRAHTVVTSLTHLLTFGNNCYGQCGRSVIRGEIYGNSRTVHVVGVDEGVRGVACGCDHTVLVTGEGKVMSCGWGADGQSGQGHYNITEEFKEVVGDTQGVDIIKVASAGDTTLALSSEGDVFGWGNSEYDQLKMTSFQPQINVSKHLPLGIGRIVDIACNCTACLAMTEDGRVFVWGYGILGLGGMVLSVERPTELPRALFGGPDTHVTGIFGGSSAFAVVNNLGNAYIWGKNRTGSLGLGHKDNQYFPFRLPIASEVIQVILGFDHSAAIVRENI